MYGETLDRCRNRQQFYFTWYLPRNGSSKKFHETDHITRCNACWNLFHSPAAKCNRGLINEIACCATCKKACVKPGLHVVVSGGFHFSYKARLPHSRLCRTCCPTGMTIWKQHRRTGWRDEPPTPPFPVSNNFWKFSCKTVMIWAKVKYSRENILKGFQGQACSLLSLIFALSKKRWS